jgi:general secretion pathway protein K
VSARNSEKDASERGFALLIVLWILVFLALLVTQLTVAWHSEARIAFNIRANAMAEAAADGAVYEAVFHLLDSSDRRWSADGAIHQLLSPGSITRVRIENEADKVNPNTAPAALLQALLREVGANARTAALLAGAIVDWRTPAQSPAAKRDKAARYQAAGYTYVPSGAPFESVEELRDVLGMTSQMLAALKPHLTVYSDSDPGRGDPVVARALVDVGYGADSFVIDEANGPLIVSVTAAVSRSDGSRFIRHAVVRVSLRGRGRPVRFLTWEEPDD